MFDDSRPSNLRHHDWVQCRKKMVKRSRDAGAAVKVGFVGWRGMVGSVLMERMRAENDFAQGFEATFYTTSNVGGSPPEVGLQNVPPLADATSVEALQPMDIVVTCQGGDYTKDVHPRLRAAGWGGLWIDAASALRMKEDAVIVLDPVNMGVIEEGLKGGVKDYIGGNCTVSLMLMALGGLFQKGWVEWATSMTYQAASGAGAKNMRELVAQMGSIAQSVDSKLMDDRASILDLDRSVSAILSGKTEGLPTANFGAPLAGSLIPWIDAAMENGQTKEEWKGQAETNKILGNATPVPIDGTCVRIGAMRCHSQAITIKLKKAVPLAEIEKAIGEYNEWSVLVPNTKEATLKQLSPAYVSGTLLCPVGRVRKLNMGEEYLSCFTVGDQLLWGAAEPVRRMLNIALKHIDK